MRQAILLLTIALFISTGLQGQKINYELSFEKARASSQKEKKPLAVLITIQSPVYSPDYLKGINDERVIGTFNNSFINFKVDREDTATARVLIKEYNIYRFPALVFFDIKGGLMFSDVAILASPQLLLGVLGKAIEATKENSLADFDSLYKAGDENTSFLKRYILKRERAGISNNAELIEKYVEGLKVSDLNRYDEVLFILKAGPYADGNAYRLSRTNRSLIDSIYKTEALAERTAMNNAIITNTMNSAIAGKNLSRAVAAASFTMSTWGKDIKEGQKRYQVKLLDYYSGIKDTAKYLKSASSLYDQNYMNISADSVRKIDSLNFNASKIKAMENMKVLSTVKINDSIIRRTFTSSVTVYHETEKVASELNNAAWSFYLMAGNNDDYLIKAMLWSRRSIELSPKSPFYDTYAHLLYKCRFYNEAEAMAKKAIETAIKEKMDSKPYREAYEKISKRTM